MYKVYLSTSIDLVYVFLGSFPTIKATSFITKAWGVIQARVDMPIDLLWKRPVARTWMTPPTYTRRCLRLYGRRDVKEQLRF